MIDTKLKISQQQWFFILLFSNICVTPFSFTPMLYQTLESSAWIAIVLAFIISIWNVYVTVYLCEKFRDENVAQWSKKILGKWLGTFYTMMVILVLYLWGILMLGVFLELIIDSQLPYTPRFLILTFLLGAIVYILIMGLETWVRWGELFAILLLLTLIVINVAQLNNITIGNLLPIQSHLKYFRSAEGWSMEVFATLFIFRGVFALYFIYPYIQKRKNLTVISLSSTTIAFIEIFLAIVLPILIFGHTFIQKIAFPYQASLETVTFSFLPIDRISILTSIVWQLIIVYVLCVSFFSTAEGVRSLLKLKKSNVTLIIIGLITFVLALYPFEKQLGSLLTMYWSFTGIVIFTIIPTILWVILKWTELE